MAEMSTPSSLPGEPRTRHLGRGHLPALDGLRGLAVLGVMTTHLYAGNPVGLPVPLVQLAGLGTNGVDLFFVLSGFLITGILHDSLGDAQYLRKFYARRVLRIFPLYYAVVLLLMLFTRPLHIQWHGLQWSLLLYLQNTDTFFPSLVGAHTGYVSLDHLWSLAVEEQFYLVWPLVVLLVRSARWLFALCGVGMVLAFALRIFSLQHGSGFDWMNRNTLCRADELLGGAALALLIRSRYAERVSRWAGATLCTSLVLTYLRRALLFRLLSGKLFDLRDCISISLDYSFAVLIAGSMLAWCLQPESRFQQAFSWPPLRTLGKYSYGLYVIHLVLLPGIDLLVLEPLRATLHNKVLARLAAGTIAGLLSAALAYGSFHLYEKRFLRLKRFFDYAPRPATKAAMQ